MDFQSRKIWIGRLTKTSQNENIYIDSHSKKIIGYMMYHEMINSNKDTFLWKP
jgi:hypothetical protein